MSTLQYVMAGIGAFALLGGLAMLVLRIRTMVSGCKADATIVDEKIEVSHGKNGREIRVQHPIFEFTHDGKRYRCQSTLGSSSFVRIGSKVTVRYLPSDPQSTAERDTFFAFWGFPIVAFAFGAALVWVGLGGLK